MIDFKPFLLITDKYESLFTLIVHNTSLTELISTIMHKIKKISMISNTYKRKYLNDRLYNFKLYLEDSKIKDLNHIFLISNEIHKFEIKNELKILKEFNIRNITLLNGEYFNIDYINDLFYNTNFKHIIEINNKKVNYLIMTKTKKKTILSETCSTNNIFDFLNENNIKNKCLIHGVSTLLKNNKSDNHFIFNKKLDDNEIFKIFDEDIILSNHEKLKKDLLYLQNEKTINRIIFYKEIENAINNQMIKTLYCSPKKKKIIFENFSSDLLNFEIIEIKSLHQNDIGIDLRKKI